MVDKALAQGNAFLELIDFNPLVYGVGLGDITGAQHDHLLHFLPYATIGAVGHGEGAPFSRKFQRRLYQRRLGIGIDGLAQMADFAFNPVPSRALLSARNQRLRRRPAWGDS